MVVVVIVVEVVTQVRVIVVLMIVVKEVIVAETGKDGRERTDERLLECGDFQALQFADWHI